MAQAPHPASPAWPAAAPALTLALRSELAACASAQRALHDLLQPLAPSPRASFGLDLVLEEWLMNQVRHAHPGSSGPAPVWLTAWLTPDTLTLQLADRGVPFDPLAHPAPVAPTRLDDAQPGGLGLHLLRRYAQQLAYERVDGENRLLVTLALR